MNVLWSVTDHATKGAPSGGPVDVAIIGAGVSGCSCALKLARSGKRVRVYETRTIGSGASGRNAGFALRGCAIPYHTAREQLGGELARELWQRTEIAIGRMTQLGHGAFSPTGSVRVASSLRVATGLSVTDCPTQADELEEISLLQAEFKALREDGFAVELLDKSSSTFDAALVHPPDAAFDPGAWMSALSDHCVAAGVEFSEGVHVRNVSTLAAEHVVIATDGYSRGLLPLLDERIRPVRNQVIATAPLGFKLFTQPHYARWGFDYWRQTADGRLIVGGRRDTGGPQELTDKEAVTETVQTAIESLVLDLLGSHDRDSPRKILPEITHRWSGIFGVTRDQLPIVGPVPDLTNVWVAAGYCGQGNVLGFICGELVADAILGQSDQLMDILDPSRPRLATSS